MIPSFHTCIYGAGLGRGECFCALTGKEPTPEECKYCEEYDNDEGEE